MRLGVSYHQGVLLSPPAAGIAVARSLAMGSGPESQSSVPVDAEDTNAQELLH